MYIVHFILIFVIVTCDQTKTCSNQNNSRAKHTNSNNIIIIEIVMITFTITKSLMYQLNLQNEWIQLLVATIMHCHYYCTDVSKTNFLVEKMTL